MPTSERLKVCMVVHQSYYGDARVIGYAEALDKIGAQVDVLCLRNQVEAPIEQKSGIRIYTLPLRRQHGNPFRYLIEYSLSLILFSIWLLVLYIKNRYHLIHIHNMPDVLVFIALIPKLLGAKLILDVHDPMPELFMAKYQKPSTDFFVKMMWVEEKLSAYLAHAVITANNSFAQNLSARGIPEEKIFIVRTLPDPAIFDRKKFKRRRGRENESYTLIYPGTIAPRYGLDIAIRALPQLVKKIPNIQLVIFGKWTDYAAGLLKLADRLGVSSSVQFKPPIPWNQVPGEIADADVGIYTARSNPHMDIAIPGKVLEYAVMGIPIITSRLKVVEQLFSDSQVMFFTPGDIHGFAKRVLELYDNPSLRYDLLRNMDETFIREHNWHNEQVKYFSLLNKLVGRLR